MNQTIRMYTTTVLTFLDAVFLGALVVGVLLLLGDALGALVVVVL